MAWDGFAFLRNRVPVNGVISSFAFKRTAVRFKMPNKLEAFQAGSSA